ncbi:SWIM zinc finger family protein [Lipingzhangella sp. LS1_29]|uniref:SWIM zinc finger family protein n=1 Tax=Lipingzhangella rawalii TaxID=2055835 RepID=A0ABU2H5J5_9ACTN|nr:SWIM zinc finger family protein [Lipingzhangella rawalii]MDS1270577.1 SWIM zinc finger family protein [Lipingzhangella rawalii]
MAAAYTADDLLSQAGATSFERGADYVTSVANLRVRGGELHAIVHGREPYRVRLGVGDGLAGDCTCPHAEEGNFCKHLVAVGLAKLRGTSIDEDPEDADDEEELRTALSELDHGELVDLLVDAAATDEHLALSLWWAVDRPD